MSFADEVINEISSAEPAPESVQEPTPTETEQVDKPAETVAEEPAKETEPEVDKAETVEPKEEEPTQTEEPAPAQPKPKKDLSGLSKEEKAEFAFKRQLEKQRNKYESEIAKMNEQFATINKKLEEIKNPQPKEQPKTRTDFDSDDEYISYLAGEQVKAQMEKRDADEKAKAEQEEANKAMEAEEAKRQQELTERFTSNCQKTFGNEADYAEFAKKVNRGLANGLGELLDQVPNVRDYLFTNENGPRVLNRMLTNKEDFVRVMSLANNPIEATIELHEMAKETLSAPADTAPQQPTTVSVMPNIGKPGKATSNSAPDVFGSDKSLIDFVRKHR